MYTEKCEIRQQKSSGHSILTNEILTNLIKRQMPDKKNYYSARSSNKNKCQNVQIIASLSPFDSSGNQRTT